MAWPKPMILSLRSSMPRVPLMASCGVLNSSIISMAASLAPPCSGPRSEPMAAVMHEYRSDRVEAHTRAVKVEALNSCSA
ncbi:hypothetical protein D3C77_680820 [compost metagenome]